MTLHDIPYTWCSYCGKGDDPVRGYRVMMYPVMSHERCYWNWINGDRLDTDSVTGGVGP